MAVSYTHLMCIRDRAYGIVTAPDHFCLSMLGEVIVAGHVHLEIVERMGDVCSGFIESDHATNFSHGLYSYHSSPGSIW